MTIKWLQNFQPDSGNSTTLFDLVSKIDSTDSCFSGAPSHRSKLTVDRENISGFIELTNWPPNSPALNPVDCSIWGTLQQLVYIVKKSMMLITWNNSWSAAGTQLARDWWMRNTCCWSYVRKMDILNIVCIDYEHDSRLRGCKVTVL